MSPMCKMCKDLVTPKLSMNLKVFPGSLQICNKNRASSGQNSSHCWVKHRLPRQTTKAHCTNMHSVTHFAKYTHQNRHSHLCKCVMCSIRSIRKRFEQLQCSYVGKTKQESSPMDRRQLHLLQRPQQSWCSFERRLPVCYVCRRQLGTVRGSRMFFVRPLGKFKGRSLQHENLTPDSVRVFGAGSHSDRLRGGLEWGAPR